MRILLFGPPGVGKGTQAALLSKKYNFTKFSTGDFLRSQMSLGSPLGDEVADYIRRGNLVPDDVIMILVKNFLIEHRDGSMLFDGFPRTMDQAIMLEKALAKVDMSVDIALEMKLNENEIMKRLLNRRHCPNCGRIYNFLDNSLDGEGICSSCHQKLVKRVDDDEAIIKRRMRVYGEQTKPLADYYKSLSVHKQIDASGSQEEVFRKIAEIINGYINKK